MQKNVHIYEKRGNSLSFCIICTANTITTTTSNRSVKLTYLHACFKYYIPSPSAQELIKLVAKKLHVLFFCVSVVIPLRNYYLDNLFKQNETSYRCNANRTIGKRVA